MIEIKISIGNVSVEVVVQPERTNKGVFSSSIDEVKDAEKFVLAVVREVMQTTGVKPAYQYKDHGE